MHHPLYDVFGEYPIPTVHALYNTFTLMRCPTPRICMKGGHIYVSWYFTLDSFLPVTLANPFLAVSAFLIARLRSHHGHCHAHSQVYK